MTDNSTSWQERLKDVLGPGGYADSYMRRSLQTVLLYEAMRCIQPHQDILRPFQKRALLLMQVHKLLDSLDFLTSQQKEEVLWRTQKRGEQLNDDIAWSRAKTNVKYLRKTVQQLRPFIEPGRSHQEAVNEMVRHLFKESLKSKTEGGSATRTNPVSSVATTAVSNPPPHWEFFHNHTILTLRLYYQGDQLVADFPRMEPDIAMVPLQRPDSNPSTEENVEKPASVSLKDPPTGPVSLGDNSGFGDTSNSAAFAGKGSNGAASAVDEIPKVAPSSHSRKSSLTLSFATDNNSYGNDNLIPNPIRDNKQHSAPFDGNNDTEETILVPPPKRRKGEDTSIEEPDLKKRS